MLLEGSISETKDSESFFPSSTSLIPRHLFAACPTDLEFTLSSSDMVGSEEFNDGVEDANDEEPDDEADDKYGVTRCLLSNGLSVKASS